MSSDAAAPERPPLRGQVAPRVLAGAALATLLLVGLFLWAEPGRVWAALRAASVSGVLAVCGVHLLALVLRVQRWKSLLAAADCSPPPNAPRSLVWDAVFFGWLGNLILPARLGELLRPAMYAEGSGRSFAPVFATLAVERAADLLVVAVGGWLALTVLPGPAAVPSELVDGVRWLGLGAGVALAALLGMSWWGSGSRDANANGLGTGLIGLLRRFAEGLGVFRRPGTLGVCVLWTSLIWGVEACCVYLALDAFGLPLSWSASVAQVVAVTISISVVTTPAGLGVEQGVTVGLFSAWGIAGADALALSLVTSFAAAVWIAPGGLVAILRQGLPRLPRWRSGLRSGDVASLDEPADQF